jgi:hypothetical protein
MGGGGGGCLKTEADFSDQNTIMMQTRKILEVSLSREDFLFEEENNTSFELKSAISCQNKPNKKKTIKKNKRFHGVLYFFVRIKGKKPSQSATDFERIRIRKFTPTPPAPLHPLLKYLSPRIA